MFSVRLQSVFLFYFLCGLALATDPVHDERPKREASSSLFPFPRVGRSSSSSWTDSELHEFKRQGLVPFPRIGRSGKRDTSQGTNGGMWFGPRLGRLQKRDIDPTGTWAIIQLREIPFLTSRQVYKDNYTPRLGRESGEDQRDQQKGHQPDPNNFTPRLGRENLPEEYF